MAQTDVAGVTAADTQGKSAQQQAEAAQATQTSQPPVKVTAEQLGLNVGEPYAGALDIDLGNLTAWDPSPIDAAAYEQPGPSREAACAETARAITQSLVNALFALPSQSVTGGRLAELPAPTTRIPRQQPLPKPKPLTKWQKFAQQKGITKRKRSKLAFDETSQTWKRRHGYGKANDEAAVPIIEARASDKPGEDPFSRMEQEKRERVKQNRKSQLENAKVAAKAGALPATLKIAATLTGSGTNSKAAGPKRLPREKRKELREEIKVASRLSGVATASMGKFDRQLKGEKPGERSLPGKRRKYMAVTDTKTEHNKMSEMAGKFLRERADDILDVRKAISKHESVLREERRQAKELLMSRPKNTAGKGGKGRGGDAGGEGGSSKGGAGKAGKGGGHGVKKGGVSKKGGKGRKGK